MAKGVIYVLTNPSFPEYVKIGYADDFEKRLKQLNQSECLPFAFRAYCLYEVNSKLKDKDVHKLIDKINPDLRAIETFDGKPRVREFYNISAQDAYEILESIAAISGTEDRLKMVQPECHEITDEEVAATMQDASSIIYTEANHMLKASEPIKQLYDELKAKILTLSGVIVEPKKYYIAFKYKTNFCDIEVQRSKLRVMLNMTSGTLSDDIGFAEDLSGKGHWGNGDYVANLKDTSMTDYVFSLIKQSYHNQDA